MDTAITEKSPQELRLKGRKRKKKLKDYSQIYLMLLPNFILFIVVSVYPVMWALRYMFYDFDGFNTPKFTGLDNLVRAFTRDENFWHTVVNTLVYSGGKICLVLPLAFIIAVLLNGRHKGSGLLQAIIFSPTILSSAVMALIFYLLLNAYNGELNRLLLFFHVIAQPINWLGKDMAMISVIVVAIWGGLGNYMVYFLAGLQQVPNELYESGEIDGTNKFTRLWYITLPMLGPVLKIIIMLSILSAFQDMQSIMVLTEGGPFESTDVMFLYVYRLYFPVTVTGAVATRQYGYGAAVAIICAAIVGVVTLLYLYVSRKMDDIY